MGQANLVRVRVPVSPWGALDREGVVKRHHVRCEAVAKRDEALHV